jgi:2,3-bisphosphoglycerate-dependent phosphoglycerate mutase
VEKRRRWVWIPLVIVAVVIIAVVCCWWWCDRPVTTALIVRHAEKVAAAGDAPLSADGQARAEALVHVAGDAGVVAVYATQWQRTQQTVQPLADQLLLPVNVVDASDVEGLVDQVLADHAGEVVMIAGHSDTVPDIIEEFGADPIPAIAENEYDNLYVVTVYRFNRAAVVHLNYGDPD